MSNIKNILSLKELTTLIQRTIATDMNTLYWVKAELVKLNCAASSGHCYPELVEKEGSKISAQMRGIIWKDVYSVLSSKFKRITHTEIASGMQLLLQVQVTYSPVYGLSLMVMDIDPTYTTGALAYEKQQTIDRLTEEGVMDLNKSIPMPWLLQKLAIISADSSKGYNDFMQTIDEYAEQYSIFTKLYNAVLQGNIAVSSQIAAFEEIKMNSDSFDAVILIRGGGGDIDMNCYDNHELAYEIATFPIPVITGIGHSTDTSVADMVSAARMRTPTEAANFVLSGFARFEEALNLLQDNIIKFTSRQIDYFKNSLNNIASLIITKPSAITAYNNNLLTRTGDNMTKYVLLKLTNYNNNLNRIVDNISKNVTMKLNSDKIKLDNYDAAIKLLSPLNILKRGYSISYLNGKAITDTDCIKEGDIIETQLYNGKIESKTTKIISNERK